jgi:Amt family ammonium transporter
MATIETSQSPDNASMYQRFFTYVGLLLIIGIVVGGLSTAFGGASAGATDPNVNQGDTAWVLTGSALVMLMTPVVGLFYSGLVTSKNAISLIKQSVLILAIVSIQWILIGYSLVFGPDFHGIIGDLSLFGLRGVGYAGSPYAPTIPQSAFMIFQAMGAIIAPALIIGSIAERIRFRTLVLFVLLWTTLVYDPIAHWVVGNGGWLQRMHVLDFAGGTFVHAAAGFSGLAAAIVIGKRRDFKIGQAIVSHNIPFVVIGAGILWFGWLGFNGGSALQASPLAVNAFLVTNTSGAAGALVWMILSWVENKKPSAMATAIGAVCGLIAITPASGYVGPMASIAIGTIAGVVTYLALHLRSKYLPIDDTLDVWAAHGMGGVTGIILAGVFAENAINPNANSGLLFGNPGQLGVQILAAFVTLTFAFVVTVILLSLLAPLGLRVSRQEEQEGLDLATHGEEAYTFASTQGEADSPASTQEQLDWPAAPGVWQGEERVAQPGIVPAGFSMQMEVPSGALHNRFQGETAPVSQKLETENGELRQRLDVANDRLRQLLEAENNELRMRLHTETAELRLQLEMANGGRVMSSNTSSLRQFVPPSSSKRLV